MSPELPNIDPELLDIPTADTLVQPAVTHKPRILLLYGSNRARSYSRLLSEEAARLLEQFGAETRIFNPSGLPLPDDAPEDHPKVQELRKLVLWSEGMVWCSPERHGAMTGGVQVADRLDSPEHGRGTPDPGQDPGADAGQRRLAVFQCVEPDARVGALDAYVHHSQPVFGGQGFSRI